MALIKAERVGAVATLTLVREKALNSLNLEMSRDINKALDSWGIGLGSRPGPGVVKCLIVKGEGKAFCAGGDVRVVAPRFTCQSFAGSILNRFWSEIGARKWGFILVLMKKEKQTTVLSITGKTCLPLSVETDGTQERSKLQRFDRKQKERLIVMNA